MKIEIEITEQEVNDLKAIRNYFGEHDKTLFEHKAYAVVDNFLTKLSIPEVSNSFCFDCWKRDGKIKTKIIKALNVEDAELLFKAKYPEYAYDKPY